MKDLFPAGRSTVAARSSAPTGADAELSFDTPAQHIVYLEKALLKQKELLARNQKTLTAIYSSHGWRILVAYYGLRERLLPPQSWRRTVVKNLFHWTRRALRAAAVRKWKPAAHLFDAGYARWIKRHEPGRAELDQQRRTRFAHEPRISILVPTFNTPEKYLEAMVHSVLAQTYGNWELCIADGASQDQRIKDRLQHHRRQDARIKVDYLPRNKGIAGNSNAALDLATGEFVALLDHDDTLAPFALFEVVRALNAHPDADLIYSDEDKIDESGKYRSEPHFKPDWSPDTLRSHNYICHLAVFRHELFQRVGRFRPGFDGSQDYDAILRVSEQARRIVHIRRVLYHWRCHAASTAGDTSVKMYAYESGKKALTEHLQRRQVAGSVLYGPVLGTYQVTYALARRPLVSVLIANRDHPEVLHKCLTSIARSSYTNHEVLIVENHSEKPETFEYYRQLEGRKNLRVLTWKQSFNYASVNNFAAAQAKGEMLLLLNNDIEAINPDWIERLLEHALRPEVGAVGAKLYYPNETIQHGGVIVGLRGTAGHAHAGHPRNAPGYFARLIVTQNFSAVTAACLMVRKEVFAEVQGFDERFILAFNDIDLCLKLRQRGYLIVWTPHAELYHFESMTRGTDFTDAVQSARFAGEGDLLLNKWSDWIELGDPYYNPNLDLLKCSFTLSN